MATRWATGPTKRSRKPTSPCKAAITRLARSRSRRGGRLERECASAPQHGLQKNQRLCPRILGRGAFTGRAGIAVLEAVAGIFVTVKIVRDAVAGHLGGDLNDLLGGWVVVPFGRKTGHRAAGVA